MVQHAGFQASAMFGGLDRGLSCYSGSNAFLHFVLCSDFSMKSGLSGVVCTFLSSRVDLPTSRTLLSFTLGWDKQRAGF